LKRVEMKREAKMVAWAIQKDAKGLYSALAFDSRGNVVNTINGDNLSEVRKSAKKYFVGAREVDGKRLAKMTQKIIRKFWQGYPRV
jgi:hypothetical protein